MFQMMVAPLGTPVGSRQDCAATGLPRAVNARRVSVSGVARARCEVEQCVPVDTRLRGLDLMTLAQLKEAAAALGADPDGAANAKESFLRVLRPLAAGGLACLDWVPASDELISRLPRYLRLSGADAADADAQLLTALKFTYRRILASNGFVTRVEELQGATEAALAGEIDDLCVLIEKRCDGLSDVSIKPQVSFRDALSGVQVIAQRDGHQLDFSQVGTGRRRQLTQAIWEWSNQQLTTATDQGSSVVIAYDEPDTYLDYARQRSFTLGLALRATQLARFAPSVRQSTKQSLQAQREEPRQFQRALATGNEREAAASDQDQADDGGCDQERAERRERLAHQLAEQEPHVAARR